MSVMIFIITAAVFLGGGLALGLLGKLGTVLADDARSLKKCTYTAKDEYRCEYKSGCGKEFFNAVDNGNPISDWMEYCPYCGGQVKETTK